MSAFLFRFRKPLSAANALILMALLAWLGALTPQPKRLLTSLPSIELTLLKPQITPQPLPPVEPLPKTERTAPRHVTRAAAPAMTLTETGATPNVPHAPAGPTSLAAPVAAQAPPSAPAEIIPAAASSPISSGREAEAAYAGKVRAYLQSVKRYPTGREASLQRPSGTVAIWFTLRRSGDLADAGIETSSGAMLLDNAALTTVRRGVFPVFPDEAWVGKAQQRFTVELEFVQK